jgi:hypothetical protein
MRPPPRTARRSRLVVLAVALATAVPAAVAVPTATAAAPPRTCRTEADGIALARTVVRGDLRIEGTGCFLESVDVRGHVLVGPGAEALVLNSRLAGDLRLGRGTRSYVVDSQVGRDVLLDGPAYLQVSGLVRRDVRGAADTLDVRFADVGGRVDVAVPATVTSTGVTVWRSGVVGPVHVRGGRTSVADAYLAGGLTLTDVQASVVSETVVDGDVVVRDARGEVHVGDLRYDRFAEELWVPGPPTVRTWVGGDLVLDGTPAVVGSTDVAGDLACPGAGTVVLAPDVTVGGDRTGRCVPVPPSDAARRGTAVRG